MKKNIKIIRKDLNNKNHIIETVKRGYAFNYLIPNKLAEVATKGRIKHISMLQAASLKRKDEINKWDEKINTELTKIKIVHLRKKCGKNSQIFGKVSEQEIQTKILKLVGKKIEKKNILIDPIKQIGIYTCEILINEKVTTHLTIRLLPYNL